MVQTRGTSSEVVTEARAASVRLSVVGAVHAAQHGGRGEGEVAASSVGEGVSLQELHGRWRQGWRRRRCLFSQPLGLLRSVLGSLTSRWNSDLPAAWLEVGLPILQLFLARQCSSSHCPHNLTSCTQYITVNSFVVNIAGHHRILRG